MSYVYRIIFKFFLSFIVTIAVFQVAYADDMENKLDRALQAIERLSQENQELKERLTKLENAQGSSLAASKTSNQKKSAIKIPADIEQRVAQLEELSVSSGSKSALDKLSIHGYSSFEYEHQTSSQGFGDSNGSFDADLFDVVLNVQVNDKLRAAADFTWEHGSATEDNRGNVALEYGFAEYAFSDLLKLRAGKMFTPFGIFNEIHTAKPAYLSVKEAGSTNKPKNIITGASRFYPRWGTGLALQGNGEFKDKHFDYNLMLTNGEQETTNPFEEDDNKSKAITFRTRHDVTDNIQLGYSVYYDKGVTSDTVSHGLQFEYFPDKFRFLAEGVWGEIDSTASGTTHHYGWFVQPSYHFNNGLTPYFRFEHYDPDANLADNHGFDAVLGFNYNYNNLIFKLENNYFFGASGSTLGALPNNGYNEVKAAIVVGF